MSRRCVDIASRLVMQQQWLLIACAVSRGIESWNVYGTYVNVSDKLTVDEIRGIMQKHIFCLYVDSQENGRWSHLHTWLRWRRSPTCIWWRYRCPFCRRSRLRNHIQQDMLWNTQTQLNHELAASEIDSLRRMLVAYQ